MPISAIIVDDEPLAREGLMLRIGQESDFNVLTDCACGAEALDAIHTLTPDVVFADIEMPGLSGFELVNALNDAPFLPKIIFVTAYQEFALEAFECQVFDYLLKPYSDARLASCLNKLRQAYSEQVAFDRQQQLTDLLGKKTGKTLEGFMSSLAQQASMSPDSDTLIFKNGTERLRLVMSEILWVEAAGDYLYLHTQRGNFIVRQTLKQLETELHQHCFPRVSRSAMINMSHVTKLTPNSNGEYYATLNNGDEVKVSRKYRAKLHKFFY
ncbi:LytTR family DNA-binding domain-containing protein [Aestuariibacter sp. AA17]|uniref:LytTR family DNA-binding domain-containing protein n=1 Tax=Fluctibacter corallii TaxID=2984329 RepID=A0ABT3A7Y9_9ALTE|nr:LytTR family DNA-binding domain-containing protein [Aestuariibacter sp. AA17]MCV2884800.1 LytTR family DNA-binding domain-containing protein [Aestuariibacter sp. AA17]